MSITKKGVKMETITKTKKQVLEMTQSEFHDLLKENTDRNYHTENVVYLAYRYGDNYLIAFAEMVLIAHLKIGHMTPGLQKQRSHVMLCLKARMLPCYKQTLKEYFI
tara:strand:+ start:111 stop:431 length:321 start_codon:yes stop_codon:yes gene_type:complete